MTYKNVLFKWCKKHLKIQLTAFNIMYIQTTIHFHLNVKSMWLSVGVYHFNDLAVLNICVMLNTEFIILTFKISQ